MLRLDGGGGGGVIGCRVLFLLLPCLPSSSVYMYVSMYVPTYCGIFRYLPVRLCVLPVCEHVFFFLQVWCCSCYFCDMTDVPVSPLLGARADNCRSQIGGERGVSKRLEHQGFLMVIKEEGRKGWIIVKKGHFESGSEHAMWT